MRIRCESIDDYIANLVHAKGTGQELFENCVRVSINYDDSEASAVVYFHSTAIIQNASTEYLLSYDEQCGVDYHDNDAGLRDGTARADFLKQKIADLGWTVLPGIIEV
jgi:spore coat polysaccharide biosynthesis protein SpsF (cytidylyltransferase family)